MAKKLLTSRLRSDGASPTLRRMSSTHCFKKETETAMRLKTVYLTLALGVLAVTQSGLAGADIYKCMQADGTLTIVAATIESTAMMRRPLC